MMVSRSHSDQRRQRPTARLVFVVLALILLLSCFLSDTNAQTLTSTPSTTSASGDGSTVSDVPSLTTDSLGDDASATSQTLPTGVRSIEGQPPPTTSSSPRDPLLAIMPEFAFSMPAQLVVGGVDLALTIMLTIQLIFTIRYHYPLSKRNYCLQSASTTMLLIAFSVHLSTVLDQLRKQSHSWPYMFEYIAVQIPPQDGQWTKVEEVFYLIMRALTALLIHLTHIQFLTLLFPSALEARLILWMLGPLALAASGMEFTALSSDDDVKTSDLGDAIRNICNSTLFLLYGSGILIWGFLVNRRRAWRTDGGTAAFGGGALGLAAINTMISFVEIAYDRLWWLPDICWALTIWQSWLGFWWWVGAGMGIGEVEDRAERQQRKLKRLEKARRKKEREERAREKALTGQPTGPGSAAVAVAASLGGSSSDAIKGGIRRLRLRITGTRSDSGTGPTGQESDAGRRTADADGDEPGQVGDDTLQSVAVDDRHGEDNQTVAGSGSTSSDSHPTTSGAGGTSSGHDGWMGGIAEIWNQYQPNFIRRRMRRLRLAHVAAAKRAATEQSALREQVLARQSAPSGPGLRTMVLENRNAPQRNPSTGATADRAHRHGHGERSSSKARNASSRGGVNSSSRDDGHARRSRATRVESDNELDERAEDVEEVDEDDDDYEDDAASTHANNGGAVPRTGTSSSGEQSWTFRGGLRGLRMRDHTTYD